MEFTGDQAVLRVRDHGHPFVAGGEAAPDPLSPSGRGLHLMRTLARSITFESNGRGNSIEVVLPVAVTAA
jgi:anti-sigma regulatory factor (Ser/Thr protein kinase)